MADPKPSSFISRASAVEALWRRGVVSWKLNSTQKQLYRTYSNATYKKVVFNCSRRLGKSFSLLVIALEQCLKVPGSQVKFAAPTAKMAAKIIRPTLRMLLADCPKDLKPTFNRNDGLWKFPNESCLYIEGTDGQNAENLRGTAAHLCIIDEAGFVDNLQYIVNDILLPQVLTTGGKLIMASTPPKSPDHDFIKYIYEASKAGSYIRRTIEDYITECEHDPPHLRHILVPEIAELCAASGGKESITWRREYLAELIKDENYSVIPEFDENSKLEIVKEWPRPSRFDTYVSMDIGFRDKTGVLFGYLDFRANKLIIEDEILLQGNKKDFTLARLAQSIKDRETQLWMDQYGNMPRPLRYSDDEMIVIGDLTKDHDMAFIPTKKHNKNDYINDLRWRIQTGQLIIHPRCVNLIHQLESATWNSSKKSFERSEEGGHQDLLDALIYMTRNVNWTKNPYPTDWGMGSSGDWHHSDSEAPLSKSAQLIKGLFIRPKS